MLARFTQGTLHLLDRLADRTRRPDDRPIHIKIGQRGEDAAYFDLRKRGYVMVARNYRSPRRRGEIDLVGWDGDVLCFIEVKTRTSRDVKPAEAAVNHDKQRELCGVAHEYLRRLPPDLNWRFDVVSVYFENPSEPAHMELFKNAFPVT